MRREKLKKYQDVTLLFCDIVSWTNITQVANSWEVSEYLEEYYHRIMSMIKKYNGQKYETIGDTFVICFNMDKPDPNHVDTAVAFAEELIHNLKDLVSPIAQYGGTRIRVGIHTGFIIGNWYKHKFQLVGDTINTAARMESSGHPNAIHITDVTYHRLSPAFKKKFIKYPMFIKSKGIMITYIYIVSKESDNHNENGSRRLNIKSSMELRSSHDMVRQYESIGNVPIGYEINQYIHHKGERVDMGNGLVPSIVPETQQPGVSGKRRVKSIHSIHDINHVLIQDQVSPNTHLGRMTDIGDYKSPDHGCIHEHLYAHNLPHPRMATQTSIPFINNAVYHPPQDTYKPKKLSSSSFISMLNSILHHWKPLKKKTLIVGPSDHKQIDAIASMEDMDKRDVKISYHENIPYKPNKRNFKKK